MELETRIAGIPATVRIDCARYTRPDPYTWASDWDYYGGWTIDFTVCDSRGRPAPWLERKLTAADRNRIEQEIIESTQGE